MENMEKKIRIMLLSAGVILFIVLAPLLILYTQGIKIDFQRWKLVKTGGFFIQVSGPLGSNILLEGKNRATTSFFSNSVFIKNLLPKKYKLAVKKENYFTWQKELPVFEGTVTEVKNIILFKTNPEFTILDGAVDNFAFSEDNNWLFLKKIDKGILKLEIWNLASNGKKEISIQKATNEQALDLLLEQWDQTNERILLRKNGTKNSELLVINYELFPEIQTSTIAVAKETLKAGFHPYSKEKILVLAQGKLWQQNWQSPFQKEILIDEAVWFTAKKNELFCLTKSGKILKITNDNKKEILSQDSRLNLGGGTNFEIEHFQKKTLIRYQNELYELANDGKMRKIRTAQGFVLSPNGSEIGIWADQEIWLLKSEQEELKTNFLSRFWKTPNSVLWLNENYLVFNAGDEIKITETDTRDNLNTFLLKTFKEPKIFFNRSDKKLYILSQGIFYISEKLLP